MGLILMYSTVKMFSQYVVSEKLNEPLESLAIEYQGNHSQAVFATAFYKLYKLVVVTSQQFFGLTQQDIASWSVEKLDYCLNHYDITNNVKFSTYYCEIMKRKFKEETKALSMQKRKAMFVSDSYEKLVEDKYDEPGELGIEYIDTTLLDLEMNKSLTERERKFCYLVVNNYSSLEIAKTLGVSQMTLTNIKKQIRFKVVR